MTVSEFLETLVEDQQEKNDVQEDAWSTLSGVCNLMTHVQ